MKLTNIALIECLGALSALDGTPKVIVDGGRETVVTVPMTFTPNVRIAIARNIGALRAEHEKFDKNRAELVRQLSDNSGQVAVDRRGEYVTAFTALSHQETDEIAITRLTEADLNLGVNPVPPTVLAALLTLIDGQEPRT